MCAACEQMGREWLHAYSLQMLVLYFASLYLSIIYNSGIKEECMLKREDQGNHKQSTYSVINELQNTL